MVVWAYEHVSMGLYYVSISWGKGWFVSSRTAFEARRKAIMSNADDSSLFRPW